MKKYNEQENKNLKRLEKEMNILPNDIPYRKPTIKDIDIVNKNKHYIYSFKEQLVLNLMLIVFSFIFLFSLSKLLLIKDNIILLIIGLTICSILLFIFTKRLIKNLLGREKENINKKILKNDYTVYTEVEPICYWITDFNNIEVKYVVFSYKNNNYITNTSIGNLMKGEKIMLIHLKDVPTYFGKVKKDYLIILVY